jgi:hypothetical protein
MALIVTGVASAALIIGRRIVGALDLQAGGSR